MRKEWVDPKAIFVHRELNNRELNQDYIGDLSQSMTDKGFLPEFPVDIFKSDNLVNIDTDLPYVCACGAHRTIAAVNAKLERVLVTIHDGREEAFIEMMHLDNFKFDPAVNSGIGQPFTQREKRAAVTQLLLLPKFFEKTNTALEEELRVPSSSIRRWRKEVVNLLESDNPILTEIWGVSDGRLARLRELAKTPERVDQEGNTVKIRKPLTEPSNEEKHAFYNQIEDDVMIVGDKHKFEWDHVCEYMQRTFGTEEGKWYIYKEVSMQQLQKIHHLLLSEEEDFIKAVVKIAKTEKRVRQQKNGLQAAADKTVKTFKKIFAPKESDYSDTYKKLVASFGKFVQGRDGFESFGFEYYDYDWKDRDDADFCESQTELHKAITDDLASDADWLKEFREKEVKRMQKLRRNAMTRWEKNREAALQAIKDYPRQYVSSDRILAVADRQLDWGKGFIQKIGEMESPSASKNTDTIRHEGDLFKKLADAVSNDREWVKEIPEAKPLVDVLTEHNSESSEESEDPLSSVSVEDIFEHLKSRMEDTPAVSDEQLNELKSEILACLGKASFGLVDAQIWLLSDVGVWLAKCKAGVKI